MPAGATISMASMEAEPTMPNIPVPPPLASNLSIMTPDGSFSVGQR